MLNAAMSLPVYMRWTRYLSGAAFGLYVARVAGEALGLPGVWVAIILSAILAAAGAWLFARRPLEQTWPALILLTYVVQPEINGMRGWAAAVTAGAFVFNWLAQRPGGNKPPRLSDARANRLIGAALFVAALALYATTAAPDVLAADSGELQVVAAQLGVAHPPGFPLYVMLAHLATRLPVGSPAYQVNLLSAVFAALTVAVVYHTGWLLTRRRLPALLAALALAVATTFWSQATTANVRSLTGLFAALILYALINFRVAMSGSGWPRADNWLMLAALFMGFGLTHHPSLIFLIAVGLLFIIVTDRSLLRSPRRWWRPIAAGLLGLLPLLYLPLRAGADVRGASADLATLPGFLEHVLATGFRGDLFYYLAPADLAQRLIVVGNVMTFQFAPILLIGMLIGFVLLLWRDRRLALLLGGTFAAYAFVAATYRAPQTVEYMLPAYVPAVLALACALAYLPDALARFSAAGRAAGALLTALILVAALGQWPDHLSASGRFHEATDARDTAGRWLAGAPPDSIILAHWHWATPLWYLQEVEGMRPDVDVRFVYPTGEPYETTWARRTAEAFAEGRPVITTWVPAAPLADLPVPEPLGEAQFYPQAPREAFPHSPGGESMLLDTIEVIGYDASLRGAQALIPGEEAVFTVAWRPLGELPDNLSLFLHLVGPDGVLYAQDDRPAIPAEGVTLTQFRLTPRPGTPEGEQSIVIGVSSGARQEMARYRVQRSYERPLTRNPVWRAPTSSFHDALIGYDWDHTVEGHARLYLHWAGDSLDGYWTQVVDDGAVAALVLPPYRGPWGVPVTEWRFPRGADGGHYVPLGEGIVWTGETLNNVALSPGDATVLGEEFRSARPINRDLVVSVRLIGLEPDGVHWAWWDLQDSVPAMGAIPTLKWVTGSFVRSPHRVTASPGAPPGQTLTGALTLYDAFTNRPLPILDERISAKQPWIPLCFGEVGE